LGCLDCAAGVGVRLARPNSPVARAGIKARQGEARLRPRNQVYSVMQTIE
jgi:hypothetical protein